MQDELRSRESNDNPGRTQVADKHAHLLTQAQLCSSAVNEHNARVQASMMELIQRTISETSAKDSAEPNQIASAELLDWTAKLDDAVGQINALVRQLQVASCS